MEVKGRKRKENIWTNYRASPDKSVICKHCDHRYKIANVNKMENHLLKCVRCPAIVKSQLRKRSSDAAPVTPTSIDPIVDSITSMNTENSQSLMQPSCSGSQNCLNLVESEEYTILTKEFSKAVFVSGSPLSLVEHPLWIEFFNHLQPQFKLPSRKNMATKLLDIVYTEIKKEVNENLKDSICLHLQCDGWTNTNNEGIINFVISNSNPYFVKSLCTEDNKHTSDFLSQEIKKVMQNYGESKFVVLIGDNARNLQRAFEIVKDSNPQIVPLNCAAHTLNLLSQDILKCEVLKEFIDLSVDIIKTIKRSQVLSSLLKKMIKENKRGETLKLPVKTRWGSHLTALKSIYNSKIALKALAINEVAIPILSDRRSTLLDDDFWSLIQEYIELLEPVVEPIFKLESNESNIHTVFTTFKDMKSKIEFILPNMTALNEESKVSILQVDKRYRDCIKPIHLAAYLLDPKTQGLVLSEDEDLDAMDFIYQMAHALNINVVVDLANYKARDGFWSKRFVWEKLDDMNPQTWWKGICSSKNLSKVAIRILSAPCTSAATERTFSKHGHIHSRKRNRLTPERAGKLTFISYNWNLLNKYDNEANDTENIDTGEDDDTIGIDSPSDFDSTIIISNEENPSFDIEFLDCNYIPSSSEKE